MQDFSNSSLWNHTAQLDNSYKAMQEKYHIVVIFTLNMHNIFFPGLHILLKWGCGRLSNRQLLRHQTSNTHIHTFKTGTLYITRFFRTAAWIKLKCCSFEHHEQFYHLKFLFFFTKLKNKIFVVISDAHFNLKNNYQKFKLMSNFYKNKLLE